MATGSMMTLILEKDLPHDMTFHSLRKGSSKPIARLSLWTLRTAIGLFGPADT
jgi:hypothetical protein